MSPICKHVSFVADERHILLCGRLRLCGMQADRERLTQLLFEQFNVAGVFMCEQSILSLYSISKTSGTVVDLGHGKIGTLNVPPDV